MFIFNHPKGSFAGKIMNGGSHGDTAAQRVDFLIIVLLEFFTSPNQTKQLPVAILHN
jgi:hypothetical protein